MSVMKLGIVFDVKNDKFKSEVKESTVAIENFSRSAKGAGSATLRLSNNTQRADVQNQQFAKSLNTSSTALATTTKHAHAAHGSITDMVKSMMIMSAVMGTVGLGAKLVTDLATFQDLRVRLRGLSDSTVDYADKESFLISLAKEHHKELTGLASGYAGLSVMVKENIINDEQARLMLEGLSNAASETGADAANLKQVLYGLNQVLGQGTVQAQELSQVVEPMPGLLSKLARAAGQETGAAFRKLVGEGKVTSEMFAKYMVTALNEYDGAAAKTANNINAKFANVSTAYLLLAKNLEQPINNALLPVLDVLTAGLISLSENTDTVSNVVFGSFALAMAHAVNALSNKAAAIVKDTVATRASNQANLMLTKSELAQAQLANQRAIQEQAAAQRMLKNAQNTTIRSKAITNLARANGQLAASEKLVALATNNVAIATNKANTARRAGAAALGLLGGPAGVAMLAAYAIGSYAMSAADAARESVNLAEKIGLADKKLTELTTKQLSLRLFNLENDPAAEIDKARLRTLKAQEEYNKVQAARGFKNPNKETDKTVLNRDVEIEALEAKFAKTKELKTKINELLAVPVSSEPKTKTPPEATKEETKLASDLSKVEQGLYTEEEAINASYIRRQAIVDEALLGKKDQETRYNQLSLALELQKDEALTALAEEKQAEEQRLRDEKVQAELNARELLDQHRRDAWENEIAELQGFHSQLEAEEAAHEDRKMEVKNRYLGMYGDVLKTQVEFERATGKDKIIVGASIAQQSASQFAQQSKTAFKIAKGAALAKAAVALPSAVMQSYENGGGYPWGLIPAGLMLATGLAQISQIRSQQPQGFATGGRIGQSQNVIEFGEQNKPEVLEFGGQNYLLGGNGGAVFNRSQLQPVSNSGSSNAIGGGSTTIQTSIVVNGEMSEDQQAELIERNSEAVYAAYVRAKNDRGEAA